MARNAAVEAIRFLTFDLVADFALFPVWWYTAGFVRALRSAGNWLLEVRRMMAVGIWAKNLFVPMFAQYDLAGRAISFMIRLFMIFARSLGVAFAAIVIFAFLVAWALFPVMLLWLLAVQAAGILG
jgi:hypothetical protein